MYSVLKSLTLLLYITFITGEMLASRCLSRKVREFYLFGLLLCVLTCTNSYLGLVARKPVFGVSDKASFKPVSSAIETSKKIDISLEASLDTKLGNKRKTKALIRLRVCAGWSAPLLFANPRRQVFSRRGPSYFNRILVACG